MGVFAALSAVAFVAAWVGPTGAALAETAPETVTVSAFTVAEGDAQEFEVEVEADEVPLAFERESYSVYVKPKPTPTPVPATSGGGSSAPAARPHYTGGGSPAEWMAAAGIPEGDWGYVDYIVKRESGWNPNATNRSSGACGLVQALPCSKVPGNGYDPIDNLRWAQGYAVGRYGSWAGAYDFWTRNHWW